MSAKPPLKIVLCSPRGFCAGVVRAIDTVERALTIYGAPVYVRHEIVHNKYVVDSLRTKGRDFRRGIGRDPRQYQRAGGIFRPWGAEIGSRRRPRPQFLLAGRHLPAGHQGAPGGGDPFQARPGNPADRAFAPSGSGRHARPIACRRGDADRDRGRRQDLYAEGSQQPGFRDADDAVDRRHRRNRGVAEGPVSRTSPARTRKTSATPPPTGSSR